MPGRRGIPPTIWDDEIVVVDASAAIDVSRSSTHDADGEEEEEEEEEDMFDESMLPRIVRFNSKYILNY